MATTSTDVNLRIALTLLQFIALALPAIYIYLQLTNVMEETIQIDESNKYHIARSSVITLVLAALLLLLSIGANIQNLPLKISNIGQSSEAWILAIATCLTIIGAIQFGFSVVVRLLRVERGRATILGSYAETIQDIF